MLPTKSICIPGTPPVDVGALLPLIDHPHFQALRLRKQLGVNYLVFPGAVHSRFEHAVGVLALTQRLCRLHAFSADDARLLQVFALLHDIGHGPFSHQIEPVLAGEHHEHGQALLVDMADALAQCGVAAAAVAAMLADDAQPLAAWVRDRNLGTDKLDYLMRDALHIGFHGTPDIERLQVFTQMTADGLAIEEKYLEDAKQLQKFYSYLHQHGYLNKTALAAQRMLQRAVQEELSDGRNSGAELWAMTDDQLLQWAANARNALTRQLVADLVSRRLYRTVLALKPAGYAYVERQADKPLAVMEWPRPELRAFCDRVEGIAALRVLENALCEAMGLPPGAMLFAAMPYFKKLVPKDLRVFSAHSQRGFWLLENDGDHRRSLESDYLRTFAVRVVVRPDCRDALAKKAPAIAEFLRDWRG
ncbi:HD domain-containing protein [Oligosphaera ethanolica]|uniref:HD/PDEase domain-containing protein n=1 Tax=Oligosphaera ethanolica TaxID=760260 RepID=A0AAE3VI36_9BACT|nr:HD domain-containing protein [Oligosphaera ethanolica]MDQ0290708.1 hypothetical protein [Oligosphaera ethanolica]